MSWKNVQYENGKYRTSEGGGGGGSSTFAGLDDVSFSDLQNGQVPKYNSTTQKWENANESGGGTVTDVTVDGISVVNQQGVAEIPAIPDGLHHYSTTEQVVGTWIDGKPIYEKTITGLSVNIPSMSWVDTGLVITNGEKCINAICRSATAIIVASVEVTSADGKVYAMGMRNTTTVLAEITLQYTKTTD